jgi:4,5-dihydroxyphthalate decarboxylase
VIRREVTDKHPWVPMALFKGFEAAKRRSLDRLADVTISRFPVPGSSLSQRFTHGQDDPWPYGIEPNLTTLDAFLGYAYEQGVHQRRLAPHELFAPSVDGGFRI